MPCQISQATLYQTWFQSIERCILLLTIQRVGTASWIKLAMFTADFHHRVLARREARNACLCAREIRCVNACVPILAPNTTWKASRTSNTLLAWLFLSQRKNSGSVTKLLITIFLFILECNPSLLGVFEFGPIETFVNPLLQKATIGQWLDNGPADNENQFRG